MAEFVRVPPDRVAADTLRALLEEYASRDGTDYGIRELSLEEKVASLQGQLTAGALALLYDLSGEHWDLVPQDRLGEYEL